MAEFSDLQLRFHAMAGTYIAGKMFAEYCFIYRDTIDKSVKGQTTIHNRTLEAEEKATKAVNLLGNELKGIGCELSITDNEVDNLEQIIYAVLELDEVNQKRVMGLIKKIKAQDEQYKLSEINA